MFVEKICANSRRTMERRLKGIDEHDKLKVFWKNCLNDTEVMAAWCRKMKRRGFGAQLKDSELVLTARDQDYFRDDSELVLTGRDQDYFKGERDRRDEYIHYPTTDFKGERDRRPQAVRVKKTAGKTAANKVKEAKRAVAPKAKTRPRTLIQPGLKVFWEECALEPDSMVASCKKMKRREAGAQLKDSELVGTVRDEKYFGDEQRDRDENINFATNDLKGERDRPPQALRAKKAAGNKGKKVMAPKVTARQAPLTRTSCAVKGSPTCSAYTKKTCLDLRVGEKC